MQKAACRRKIFKGRGRAVFTALQRHIRPHKNTGPGSDRSLRVSWSHELSDEEAEEYTLEKIKGEEQKI